MDRGSATSGHNSPSGLSLVMGHGSSASLSPLDHTAPTCSSGPHPRLGPQGCGRSSSASALLSLPFVRDLSRLNQYVFAPPFTLDNHMVLARLLMPPAFLATLDISEAYIHIPMRPNLYRYLAFSYLGQLYFFHALPFGLNVASYIFTQVLAWPLHCLGSRGISLLAYLDDIVVWHRDRDTLLAQVQQVMVFLQDMGFRLNLAKSQPYPSPSAVLLGVHWLPQTGRWHLPVEGQEAIRRAALALLRAPLFTRRQMERLVGVINFACQVHCFLRPFLQPLTKGGTIARAAERDTPALLPPPMREALTFWTSPTPWLHVPRFHSDLPCRSLWTDASHHGWGALLQPSLTGSGEWSPEERVLHVNVLELRAVLRPAIFRPPTLVSPHLRRQRVGSVHLGGVPHEVAGPPEGVDRTPLCAAVEGPDFPSAPRAYGPQRCGRRSQPRGATQHGMDTASVVVRGDPPLGGPAGSGPEGIANQPPPPSLGVRFSPSGRHGGGLSQYRLGRLRVLASLPSFGHASPAAPPDPRVSCSAGGGGSLETPRALVSSPASGSCLTPSPAYDSVPADRFGDRLALIGHLRTLDGTSFLRQVLTAWYPRRVVDTLLAAYRPSSRRQHDLAWRHFQAWLPADVSEISRVQVLEFLQHLFDVVALSPRTVLCYRAALKWPIQEAFQVDFGHDDFSRQATGFFHLRPPPSTPLPQWDLNGVLRFYAEVDVATCPLRLAFFKALFLTAWLQVTVARNWRTFLVVP